jgi:hypothetical protein
MPIKGGSSTKKQLGGRRSKTRRSKTRRSKRKVKTVRTLNKAGVGHLHLSNNSKLILRTMASASSIDRLVFFERLINLFKNSDNRSRFETLTKSLRKEMSLDKCKSSDKLSTFDDNAIRAFVIEINKLIYERLNLPSDNKTGGARHPDYVYRPATTLEIAINLIILLGKGIISLVLLYGIVFVLSGNDHERAHQNMDALFSLIDFLYNLAYVMS